MTVYSWLGHLKYPTWSITSPPASLLHFSSMNQVKARMKDPQILFRPMLIGTLSQRNSQIWILHLAQLRFLWFYTTKSTSQRIIIIDGLSDWKQDTIIMIFCIHGISAAELAMICLGLITNFNKQTIKERFSHWHRGSYMRPKMVFFLKSTKHSSTNIIIS